MAPALADEKSFWMSPKARLVAVVLNDIKE